jgi:hypothetical protein
MIAVEIEGATAVEGQLGLIERNAVQRSIGHGVDGLQFIPIKGIGEALWGLVPIGGTGKVWMVGRRVRRLMAEANTIVDEVDTRPAGTELGLWLFSLWLWL